MDPLHRLGRRTSIPSERSYLSRALSLRRTSDSGLESDKDPVGLTTVFKPLEKAIADLVFVHGLGGGSRRTWSKDEDPNLFWPQEWLPQDPAFKDVRIHTFGYDSNWNKESILNIHDFAKTLLEWIKDCPAIPRNEDVGSSYPRWAFQWVKSMTGVASCYRSVGLGQEP
jgi:hypothetical protein